MPRQNGVYYLPSPPMPLVPDTLAAAEDLNTVLSDIAAALTGSMALDGSTPFVGPVNFNGQTVGGISTLSAANIALTGGMAVPYLTVSSVASIAALGQQLNANNQNIVGVGALSAQTLNVVSEAAAVDISTAYLTVTGTASIAALGQQLNANGQNIVNIGALSAQTLNVVSEVASVDISASYLSVTGSASIAALTAGNMSTNNVNVGWPGVPDFRLDYDGNRRTVQWTGSWSDYFDQASNLRGWDGPTGQIMTLDAAGNLVTRGSVSLLSEPAPADALAAVRARRLGVEPLDVGATLALLLRALQQLAEELEHEPA